MFVWVRFAPYRTSLRLTNERDFSGPSGEGESKRHVVVEGGAGRPRSRRRHPKSNAQRSQRAHAQSVRQAGKVRPLSLFHLCRDLQYTWRHAITWKRVRIFVAENWANVRRPRNWRREIFWKWKQPIGYLSLRWKRPVECSSERSHFWNL